MLNVTLTVEWPALFSPELLPFVILICGRQLVCLAVKILLLIVLRDIILCLIGTCKQFIKLKRWLNCHSWFIGHWRNPWSQTPQWYRWVHRIPHLIGFCGSSFSVIHVLGMLVWLFVVSMLLKTNFLTGRNLKNLWNFVWHILAWHSLFVFFFKSKINLFLGIDRFNLKQYSLHHK